MRLYKRRNKDHHYVEFFICPLTGADKVDVKQEILELHFAGTAGLIFEELSATEAVIDDHRYTR